MNVIDWLIKIAWIGIFSLLFGVISYLLGILFIKCEGLGCMGMMFVPILGLPFGIIAGLYIPKLFFGDDSDNNKTSADALVVETKVPIWKGFAEILYTFIFVILIIASNVGVIVLMDSLGAFTPGSYWFPTALNPWLFGIMVITDFVVLFWGHKKIAEHVSGIPDRRKLAHEEPEEDL